MSTQRYGFPGRLSGKESIFNAGDTVDVGLFPGLGRSLGGGRGNPLQYSCLENPMDSGAWRAAIHGIAKELDTTGRRGTHGLIFPSTLVIHTGVLMQTAFFLTHLTVEDPEANKEALKKSGSRRLSVAQREQSCILS